jgi:hypothetical protein
MVSNIMAGIKMLLRNDCGHSFSPPGVSNTHVCGSDGMWAGCDTYIIEESPTESARGLAINSNALSDIQWSEIAR